MTEKEIQERLEREEAEENSEKEVSKSLTVNDILDKLEEEIIDDNDNKSVQITLFPPNCDAIDSDGDSDDEDAPTCMFSHLSRKLLEAEGEIHEADKTCDSQDEIEEDLGVFPSPSSSKGNNNNTNNNNSKVGKNTSSLEAEGAKIGGKKGVKKASDFGGSSDDDSPMLPTSGGGDTHVLGAPILGPAMRKSVSKKIGGKKGDKKNEVVADKENQPPDPEFDVDLMPPPAVMRSLPAGGRGRRKGTTTSSGRASPSDNSDEDINEKDRDLSRYLSEAFGSTVRVVPVGRRDQKGKKVRRIAAKSSEGKSAENAFARKRKATPESESGYDENSLPHKRRVTGESESGYDENTSRRRTRSQGDEEEEDSEDDDEENNSKRGRRGNPEYKRVWSKEDSGVGSKIGDFDPPQNDSNSEEVKNIKSPYDAWRLLVPDQFIEEVLEQSRIYAHQEGFGRKASVMTKDNLLCVLAVMLLSGYNILPDKRMYWERQPDCYNELVSDNIRRDTFTDVLKCLHFTDNTLLQTTEDRFFKVRPLFEHLNAQSLKYLPTPRDLSVDETMIPYYGSHADKQYIRNKPIR